MELVVAATMVNVITAVERESHIEGSCKATVEHTLSVDNEWWVTVLSDTS